MAVWFVAPGKGKVRRPSGRFLLSEFVPDVTMPVWLGTGNPLNNVGCDPNISRTTVTAVTQAPGATHQNLTITGHHIDTAAGQTYINCRFTYTHTAASDGGQFYQMTSTHNEVPTRFFNCEFEPGGTPGERYDNVYGHDIILYRCALAKGVDGGGIANSTARNVNWEMASCWVGMPAWYEDDGVHGAPTPGTHNDAHQHHSGWYVNIHGSFFQWAKYNVQNPANVVLDAQRLDFTTANGNGTHLLDGTADNLHPQGSQVYFGKHEAYYTIRHIRFCDNWLWNIDHGFKLQSDIDVGVIDETGTPAAVDGKRLIEDVEVKRNIFGGTPRNWGGTHKYYPIRYDSNCFVNEIQHAAGGTFDDTDGNVWAADANVDATYGGGQPIAGFPVRHRVDFVAVP